MRSIVVCFLRKCRTAYREHSETQIRIDFCKDEKVGTLLVVVEGRG